MSKKKLSIPDQIRVALNGRTQSWLAMQLGMRDDRLSKKMRGFNNMVFDKKEIDAINKLLSSKVEYPKEIKSKR